MTPTAPKTAPAPREPLWRDVVGDVLRRARLAQERTLKDVADAARISMPYLSELERGRKEASSEVLAAAARSLGLGLADLLALAQDELARQTQARLQPQPQHQRAQPAQYRTAELHATLATHGSIDGAQHALSAVQPSARPVAATRRTELCLAA